MDRKIHLNKYQIFANDSKYELLESGSNSPILTVSNSMDINTSVNIVGTLNISDEVADSTLKRTYLTLNHYSGSEEDVILLQAFSNNGSNNLNVGGGTTLYNSLNNILFYTSPSTTSISASERMRIAYNGNVGIGTTLPTNKLDVNGNIKADGTLKLYDITDTQTIELNPDGDSYINGKLAVGKTTNIFYPFEVQDNNTNISTTKQTLAHFYRNDGTYNPRLEIRTSTDGIDIFQTYTTVARNLTISNPSGEVLRINSNGNVGIGTTNSGTKLYISGDPALNAIGTQSLLRLERPFNAGVSFAQGADIAIGRGNTYPSTQMRFILDNGTNNPTNPQTTIMTLDSSGNVGIGTTSPTEILDVNGNIKSSGYINGKRCGAAGYLASPVNVTVTTANTYYPIGVFTVPVAADFIVGTTYPNGLKYSGTIAQTFHITWNATIESTSNNVTATIDIQKNGVSIAMSKMGTYAKTGGEIYNLSGQCVVDLDTNDEVRFVVTADNNGEVLTFDYFAASIKEFFD